MSIARADTDGKQPADFRASRAILANKLGAGEAGVLKAFESVGPGLDAYGSRQSPEVRGSESPKPIAPQKIIPTPNAY